MPKLFPLTFSPGRIGSLELRNRLIMSLYPTKYVENNKVTERMVAFFKARALGGVALIILDGACFDYPATLKGPIHLRMDADEYVSGLKKLLAAIQSCGTKAFMQLDYPGAKQVDPGTPGAQERHGRWVLSILNEVSAGEFRSIIDKIAAGAKRAREIGYDGVEVQASYGAFISQILSPLTNKREDEFGGSLENRSRFLLETVRRIKNQSGDDYPVEIKFCVDEHLPGGFNLEEAKTVAKWLEEAGADALMINTGTKKTKNHLLPPHSLPPGINISYAAGVKGVVGIPVIAAGKINGPELAENTLNQGHADFIAMTRALIADPDLPVKAEEDRPEDIRGCIFCLDDCADKGAAGIGRACTVNPFAGLELEFLIEPAAKSKRVLVVGGGPAGMQAALILSDRGHKVELFEKGADLGGHFNLAELPPYKKEVAEANRFLINRISRSNVKVVKDKEISAEEVLESNPDVVLAATGSLPVKPSIPGIDLPFVVEARAFLNQNKKAGENVVIIGGGDVGCEVADLVAADSAVYLVEILDDVLLKMKSLPRQDLLSRLRVKGVNILKKTQVLKIEEGSVTIERDGGRLEEIPADTVIYAVGSRPVNQLAESLGGKIETHAIGDAVIPSNLGDALRSAVRTAINI